MRTALLLSVALAVASCGSTPPKPSVCRSTTADGGCLVRIDCNGGGCLADEMPLDGTIPSACVSQGGGCK